MLYIEPSFLPEISDISRDGDLELVMSHSRSPEVDATPREVNSDEGEIELLIGNVSDPFDCSSECPETLPTEHSLSTLTNNLLNAFAGQQTRKDPSISGELLRDQ
jgi:hypothetical protein